MNYSSISRRFVAMLLDGLILAVLASLIHFIIPVVGAIIIAILYVPMLESSEVRATIGKHLMGIQVTDLSGRRISFGAAMIRLAMKFVSSCMLFLGHAVAFFTPRKQALHDLVADTVVIYGRSDVPVAEAWINQMKEVFRANSSRPSATSRADDKPVGYRLSELERLQALREKGAISEEEFQKEKAKLLGSS